MQSKVFEIIFFCSGGRSGVFKKLLSDNNCPYTLGSGWADSVDVQSSRSNFVISLIFPSHAAGPFQIFLFTFATQLSYYFSLLEPGSPVKSKSIACHSTRRHVVAEAFPGAYGATSLLAQAPFPLYSLSWRAGRKGTSAMGWNSLWSNRRPWSWTAVSETHAPCIVCWPGLEPTVSRAFLYSYSAVI